MSKKVEYNEVPSTTSVSAQETIFIKTIGELKKEFNNHHESVYNSKVKTYLSPF
jgi:hypothetical protein